MTDRKPDPTVEPEDLPSTAWILFWVAVMVMGWLVVGSAVWIYLL